MRRLIRRPEVLNRSSTLPYFHIRPKRLGTVFCQVILWIESRSNNWIFWSLKSATMIFFTHHEMQRPGIRSFSQMIMCYHHNLKSPVSFRPLDIWAHYSATDNCPAHRRCAAGDYRLNSSPSSDRQSPAMPHSRGTVAKRLSWKFQWRPQCRVVLPILPPMRDDPAESRSCFASHLCSAPPDFYIHTKETKKNSVKWLWQSI